MVVGRDGCVILNMSLYSTTLIASREVANPDKCQSPHQSLLVQGYVALCACLN